MSQYRYSPLDSEGAQIRLLTIPFDIKQILGKRDQKPLAGTLSHHYLPSPSLSRLSQIKRGVKLPNFYALSYVWGRGGRPREILIGGKPLPITSNLYAALCDLQRDAALGKLVLWVDAICINQEDFAERSAQIRLMRDIYHQATNVKIWLGPRTDDTLRCANFIACLTGGIAPSSSQDDEPSVIEENLMKAVFIPSGVVVNAGVAFGQAIVSVVDIMTLEYRDDKATMISDADSSFSLHQQTIEEVTTWRPSARHLKRAQKAEDFTEIAQLINKTMLQKSEWFQRMWVVQEVGVAESAYLHYGENAIYWPSFLRAVYHLHYTLNISIENISRVTGLEKIRFGWNKGKRQPLRDLLWDTRYRHATDPRDKIYSLLGLMGDPISPLLEPDYTKSVGEIYSNTTHHLIAQNISLDPICGQQVQGRREDLPTWVPDYSLDRDLAAAPLVRIDGRESIYAATGYDYHSKYLIPGTFTRPEAWDILNVTGIYIDTITQLSHSASNDDYFGVIQEQWYLTLLAASESMPGYTDEIRQGLADISSIIIYYSELFTSEKSTLNVSAETPLNSPTTTPYILDAYIHSLLCGRISASERITKEDIKVLLSLHSEDRSSLTLKNEFFIKICKALEAGMRRRKVAVTRDGHIGAVPCEAQSGDLICVLFGCSVPVVLREAVPSNSNTSETSYAFIGEAYLHGFMDAEAIVMLMKGTRHVQDFVLK